MKKKQPMRQPHPVSLDLRREVTRNTIARLLLLGWTVERISRRMHCHPRTVTRAISTPEFQQTYADLQREQLARVDRKMNSLLDGAVDGLEKQLKNPDWRARDSAISHILRIHGKFLDRIDFTGQLDHTGQVRHVQAELVEGSMSDEMRQKARELLALQRERLQRQLPGQVCQQRAPRSPRSGEWSVLAEERRRECPMRPGCYRSPKYPRTMNRKTMRPMMGNRLMRCSSLLRPL